MAQTVLFPFIITVNTATKPVSHALKIFGDLANITRVDKD
jgi:hypothetical protein